MELTEINLINKELKIMNLTFLFFIPHMGCFIKKLKIKFTCIEKTC